MPWSTENSLLLQQGSVAESKPRAMAGPKVSCPSAAMDYHCSTTGETRAQPGARHRAECPRAQLLCRAQPVPGTALPGPRWAEGRAGSCHWHILHPVWRGSCQAFQQAQPPSMHSATRISAYSNSTKLKTTTNKPSAKSTELDNSPSFNEISWLQLLPRQMSNLLSDLEKQHSIACAPLGIVFSAFFTATILSQWMPQKGGKEQKEWKVRPAAGQSAGGREQTSSGRLYFR